MKANFNKALKVVLAYEGGYANHPKDPGGPTNKGVTQRVYDGYRLGKKLKTRSVKAITDGEVADIYRAQYWDAVKGDRLPAGVDLAVFDFAVNSGTKRAVQSVQKVLTNSFSAPELAQDGIMGEVTLANSDEAAEQDEVKFIIALCDERMRFVKSLSTFGTFGQGWTRRIMGRSYGAQDEDTGVIDLAVKLARGDATFGAPKVSAETALLPKGKADPSDVALQKTPEGAAGGLATIGGAGGAAHQAGLGGWLTDHVIKLGEMAGFTHDQLEPFAQYSQYLMWVFIALGIAGAVGVVAVRYKKQKEGRA